MVKRVSGIGLSNKWRWWMYSVLAAYRRAAYGSSRLAWSKVRQPPGASQPSSLHPWREPSELSQCLGAYDNINSTIKIVLGIIIIMSPLGDIYAFASWQNRHFGGVFRP